MVRCEFVLYVPEDKMENSNSKDFAIKIKEAPVEGAQEPIFRCQK